MSDIRFNQWLHNSGTGGISQDSAGHVGIGTTVPTHVNALTHNNSILHVGIVSCNTLNAASKIEGAIDDWIIHQSDTNTRFGFPAADTFSVETNSAERLRINSTGQIGICTQTIPSDAAVHIGLTGAREYLRLDADSGNTNAYIEIQADDNRRKALIFKSGGTRRGVIGVGDSDEASATSLFFSASSNIAGNSPHMVIDSSGHIGVSMTPDTWHSNNETVMQLSGTDTGLNLFTRSGNAYISNNFRYKSDDAGVFQAGSGYALLYNMHTAGGTFRWSTSTAASSSAGSSASLKTRMVLEQDGTFVLGDRVGTTTPSSNQPVAFHSARVNPDGTSAGIATGVRCNLYVGSNSGWASGDGGVLGLGGSGTGTAGQERMWAYVHGRRQSTNGWEYGGTIDLGTADWSGSTTSKKMRIWSQGQVEWYPTDNTAYSLKYGSDVRLRFQHNAGNGNMTLSNPSSGACIFDTASDYRLKKDETAIPNALTTVKALKPYQYTWKHSNELGQGFFAHEAQAVLPDIGVVTGTKDAVYAEDDRNESYKKNDPDYQAVDYAKLVPLLTAAIKELEARVVSLESS